jgi:hypothetical protein
VAIVDPERFCEVDFWGALRNNRFSTARRPKRAVELWKTLRGLRVSHERPQPLLYHLHGTNKSGTVEKRIGGKPESRRSYHLTKCPRNHGRVS